MTASPTLQMARECALLGNYEQAVKLYAACKLDKEQQQELHFVRELMAELDLSGGDREDDA